MSKQFNQNLKGKLYTPSLVESQNMIKPSLFNFKYSFTRFTSQLYSKFLFLDVQLTQESQGIFPFFLKILFFLWLAH